MFEMLRPMIRPGGSHKGTSPCSVKDCPKTTREGKPFCSAHIERAPYVKQILAILTDRAEEERVLNLERGRINTQGFFYKETLLLLRTKDFTAKGLARRLDVSHHAAERLIVMMARDKLVAKKETSRGDMTISGLGSRDLAAPDK